MLHGDAMFRDYLSLRYDHQYGLYSNSGEAGSRFEIHCPSEYQSSDDLVE